jgi:hypothetical protein
MNRIILIGNGFDLAHCLPTSYKDFIDNYWERKSDEIGKETSSVYDDSDIRMEISNVDRGRDEKKGLLQWQIFFLNPSSSALV